VHQALPAPEPRSSTVSHAETCAGLAQKQVSLPRAAARPACDGARADSARDRRIDTIGDRRVTDRRRAGV
jgi:hypothetical protein